MPKKISKANRLLTLVCDELSAVDRPANPGAVIALLKRDQRVFIAKRAFVMPDEGLTAYRPGDPFDARSADSENQLQLLLKNGSIEQQTAAAVVVRKDKHMATITKREDANRELEAHITLRKRDGETVPQALNRLLGESDPAVWALFNRYEAAEKPSFIDLQKAHKATHPADDEDDEDAADEDEIESRARKIAKRQNVSYEKAYVEALTTDREAIEAYERIEKRAVDTGRRIARP